MARRALGPAALQVARAVDARLSTAGRVVLGVSGGADSMALAAGAAWALERRTRAGEPVPEVAALIVDHGLQAGSDRVAAEVRERVQALGMDAGVRRVHVDPASGDGPEAAARVARHAALAEAAGKGTIMVGHTLDDQAETVLLGLARGSGARSLAGMRPVAGRLVRPLLGLRRATTRQACEEWGLQVWEDPHNLDPAFTRVRVRDRVLPLMARELGDEVIEALARTADLARDDADALDAWATDASATVARGDDLDCDALVALPAAVASRVVRHWLLGHGAQQPTAEQVGRVLALVRDWRGQGPVHLAGLHVARVEGALQARGPLR